MWNVEHEGVLDLLKRAGFYYLSRLKRIHLDHALLNALIERWRRETQTFHLRHGEMTILLKDVAILTGLLVDGLPVTGKTNYDWEQLCMELLGQAPDQVKGGCVKIDWLYQHFHATPIDAEQAQIEFAARAYIMYQIGCSLFPDPSGNRVHLKYLVLLRDFDMCGQMAWGAAALAYLYRELGKASLVGKAECCGFLTLLQIWAWEHLHVGCPLRLEHSQGDGNLDDKPLGSRWNVPLRCFENVRTSDIKFYRKELDTQMESQVIWDPYTPELMARLPAYCIAGSEVWRSRVPLICYEIVEMHVPDRVLRQFGMLQHIPETVEAVDRLTRQGRSDEDWSVYHEQYITRWTDRLSTVVTEHELADPDPVKVLESYMQWYWSITRRWISTPVDRPTISDQPRVNIEKVLVDLIIDVREQIRKMSVNKAVVKSVSETLTQIENRITTVLDTLPFDAPLPAQQHDDVHPTASHRRPAIRRRTHHHILPSASTDTATDTELVPSTAASTETVLPTCVAVATELASSSPAPTTLELLPSTSTSTESLLQIPTLVVVEPASSSLAPHNMELTPSTPTSTGHATPTLTSIEPILSSPAPALLEMEPSISTSIEHVMPIHAPATAETTSSAPAPTMIELEPSSSAFIEHVASVPSLAAAEATSSTPASVITETAPSTVTSAEPVPPTPTAAPETSSSTPTTVIIEPAPSTLASGEPVPPSPAPVVTEPASSPLVPTIATPPISTPTITDSTSPTPDPVFKEPAPSTLATSMMDTAPSVSAHIEAPSAFSILTQAVQSLIQQDSQNGEAPITNKCTEEICDIKASSNPVKMEAHEANAHIEGAEMQKPMDVKMQEVTDIESQEAHGHMEANVHGTKEASEPIHGHGHVRSFVRKRKRRVYQQTSSAPH
ncbi:uncharacterized protein [Elaeis guineensis]